MDEALDKFIKLTIFIYENEISEMMARILDLTGGRHILAGSVMGRKLLTALIESISPQSSPQPVFLDFSGVDIATSSFLRESVVGFRNYARSSLENVYPVMANATAAVVEELDFFLRQQNDAFWSCETDENEAIRNVQLLGELEPAQRSTFDGVKRLGLATAQELAKNSDDNRIGPTAWNNRLSALNAKGILVEYRSGRSKSFSSLLETT